MRQVRTLFDRVLHDRAKPLVGQASAAAFAPTKPNFAKQVAVMLSPAIGRATTCVLRSSARAQAAKGSAASPLSVSDTFRKVSFSAAAPSSETTSTRK